MKTCPKCKEKKPRKAFWKDKKAKDGLQHSCKVCHREQINLWIANNPKAAAVTAKRKNLKWFGWNLELYEAALLSQNGGCKLCGGVNKSGRSLAIDHHHVTGKFRGLLCYKCNVGLGMFDDSPSRLIAAAAYLKKTS